MTDMTEIYEEGNGPPRYVARLSRTAQGVRTFTVGMSLNGDAISDEAVGRLFALENAITRQIDGPRKSAKLSGQSVTAQLRKSLVVELLRKLSTAGKRSGQFVPRELTTQELLAGLPNTTRSQLVADLSALVREGVLDVEQSKGRNPSKYRLAAGK
jgi:hypothetical protein